MQIIDVSPVSGLISAYRGTFVVTLEYDTDHLEVVTVEFVRKSGFGAEESFTVLSPAEFRFADAEQEELLDECREAVLVYREALRGMN